mmetsp:Transcript_10119/g.11752  ORF Transcript_10119/g.11752 Transcript_10119/m.11752 type:complete len:1124 (+) Transcript_10119:340-3711(+)
MTQGHFPDFTLDQLESMQQGRRASGEADLDSLAPLDADQKVVPASKTKSVASTYRSSHTGNTTSTASGGKRNLWSDMTQIGHASTQKDVWNDDLYKEDEDEESSSNCLELKYFLRGIMFEFMHRLRTAVKYPRILLYTLLVFAALTIGFIFMIRVICDNVQQRLELDASLEASQTASWFAEIFAKSLIPLRSLQQAIKHSPVLHDLPYKIGNFGAEGSLPSIQGPKSTNPDVNDYRDVSGVCDDPALVEEFQSLVEGINTNFEFEDVIITYRAAPYGVYCLTNPTTVDFGGGKVLNTGPEMGWDAIHSEDTKMKNTLLDIYHNRNHVNIWGPINTFMGMEGVHVMCGHLAVEIPGFNYQLDGEDKSIWGFVMAFIQWSNLKKKSGIDAYYIEKGYSFKLFRTDMVIDPESGATSYKEVVIAFSEPWPEDHKLHSTNDEPFTDDNSIKASISKEDSGNWIMQVKTHKNIREELWYLNIIAVVVSFIIACMVAANLTEKTLNKLLLYKIMPTDAINKLNRGQTVIERYNIVTIFFSDIVGFTKMSGEMKPIQVMKMLNELYMQFDRLVEKHGVYKVETIGDAYMVVGGAPHRIPAPEAAQKVALFALEAMELVKSFKTTDGDKVLIRAGIASGPVVAGVVGKAMPRYCFFGDTVNLASRMESNSVQLKIQCSDLTYRFLRDAPQYSFKLEQREDIVDLKGKGLTQTYWISGITGTRSKLLTGELELSSNMKEVDDPFVQSMALSEQKWTRIGFPDSSLVSATSDDNTMVNRLAAILEYRLSLALNNPGTISDVVKKEIHAYVRQVCNKYNKVNFHSFEHASHVTISMNKLADLFQKTSNNFISDVEKATHITLKESSIYFALVFVSLVHDIEHTGKPNKVLGDIQHKFYKKYKASCQEKNSIDTALTLLNQRKYRNLLEAIYYVMDKESFEKVLKWAILSTDIVNPVIIQETISRYNQVYKSNDSYQKVYDSDSGVTQLSDKLESDPTQRVAIEHAIQITDVAHITQSWENFVKWNFRLYKECMDNYENRLLPDPSVTWSVNQTSFLENYGLSLASRVHRIFGDGIADLNLIDNVTANLRRWEKEGDRITSLFISGYESHDRERDILLSCHVYDSHTDQSDVESC